MALMACLLGYGEVGLWLKKQSTLPDTWVKLDGNPYRHWIEEYGGEMYQEAVRLGLGALMDIVLCVYED
jgi:hydroxymethylpyrimidine/phosphomethylpyrimidine kinase